MTMDCSVKIKHHGNNRRFFVVGANFEVKVIGGKSVGDQLTVIVVKVSQREQAKRAENRKLWIY
jgi:hypothetical protein